MPARFAPARLQNGRSPTNTHAAGRPNVPRARIKLPGRLGWGFRPRDLAAVDGGVAISRDLVRRKPVRVPPGATVLDSTPTLIPRPPPAPAARITRVGSVIVVRIPSFVVRRPAWPASARPVPGEDVVASWLSSGTCHEFPSRHHPSAATMAAATSSPGPGSAGAQTSRHVRRGPRRSTGERSAPVEDTALNAHEPNLWRLEIGPSVSFSRRRDSAHVPRVGQDFPA